HRRTIMKQDVGDKNNRNLSEMLFFSHVLIYASCILVASLSEIAIAGKETGLFCNNNNTDICSKYQSGGHSAPLLETLRNRGFLVAGVTSTVSACVATTMILTLNYVYLCWESRKKQDDRKKEQDDNEITSLMNFEKEKLNSLMIIKKS